MLLNAMNSNSTLKFFLLLVLEFLGEIEQATGQSKILHVKEGSCDCPKSLSKVAPFAHALKKIPCYVDSAQFQSPSGLRSQNKPKLFGLRWASESLSTISNPTTSSSPTSQPMTSATTSNIQRLVGASSISPQSDVMSAVTTVGEIDDVKNKERYTTSSTTAFMSAVSTESATAQMTSSIYDVQTENLTPIKTTASSYVANNTTSTSLDPTTSSSGVWLELVQLYDLDREKQDKHLVTIQCPAEEEPLFFDFFVIQVDDVNDNTPIFAKPSLHSTVPADLKMGDSLLQLRATDADTGLNAELKFGWVKGTEQITYKNGSKARSPYTVLVLPSGFVIMIGELEPDVEFTFAVTVKDRGDSPNGNRATATATVTVYDTQPPTSSPFSSPYPSSSPTHVPGTSNSSWWYFVIPSVAILFVVIAAVCIYVRRKKQQYRRPMLVIEDSNGMDNDDEGGRFRNTRVIDPNHRRNHGDELRNADQEVLIDLAGSEC